MHGIHKLLEAPVVRHQLAIEHEADFVVSHRPGEVADAVAAVEQQTVASWAEVTQTGSAVLAEGVSAAEFAQIEVRLVALLADDTVLLQLLVERGDLLPACVSDVELHFWSVNEPLH